MNMIPPYGSMFLCCMFPCLNLLVSLALLVLDMLGSTGGIRESVCVWKGEVQVEALPTVYRYCTCTVP